MSGRRILICDDSDNIRNVLQMNFEWLGYEVSCACDGEEALRRVSEDPPDLIVLDVMMPRLNGYQVCRSLKSNPDTREIPVIFLSAKDQQGDRFWGRDCGADEYLTKPFSAAKLEKVVQKLLADEGGEDREGDITAKIRALKAEGNPCSVVRVALDSKALQVYRQKYGEIRYEEAIEVARSTMESVFGAALPETVIERSGEGIYRAVLPCDSAEADALLARIRRQAGLSLMSLYSKEDAERGFVITKVLGGEETHVPLMTVETNHTADAAVA